MYQLFAADGDTYGEKGIARRLRDSLTATIQSIEETAGNDIKTNSQFTIGKNLDDLDDRMTSFESRLQAVMKTNTINNLRQWSRRSKK